MTCIEAEIVALALPQTTSIDPKCVARALSEIAEAASETLELQDVFDQVADSIRRVIPFDHMGVTRILEGQRAVKHATTLACPKQEPVCFKPCPLTAWSPGLRPKPGTGRRIEDAELELDPAFPGDADFLRGGMRSALWQSFRIGSEFGGGVWLASGRPHAFTDEHQQILRPIAALLGSTVEHWRIWAAERRRRERLDQIDGVLGTLAESLDILELFQKLSDAVRPILPHHLMVLSELDIASRTVRLVGVAGESDLPPPAEPVPLTEQEIERRLRDFEIMNDIPAEIEPVTERNRLLIASGMRSWVRVPVWVMGQVNGTLGLFHREPSQYDWEDAEAVRRVADRIALMQSHYRLAEEARVAAEARERAERLEATVETLTRDMAERDHARIIGVSRSWKEALLQAGRVARSDTSVLLTGESGTGKEVISRFIHQGSARAEKPFVAINCAALPEQLLESELFGHEKGAFTGAIATKIGRIEQAAGGTLFLDEIGEMSPGVQAKFLRVLQEREFQRVGGTRTLRADVRVIAATNRDLATAMQRHEFREDLYYRLNVFQIHIAALRDRPEDILPLAEVFLEELSRTMGHRVAGISRDARDWLVTHTWPGNVRELRNAIERAILLCDGGLITREHLPTPLQGADVATTNGDGRLVPDAIPAQGVDLEAVERDFVVKALAQAKGNKARAARLLGLTRSQLYSRIEKYGIQP